MIDYDDTVAVAADSGEDPEDRLAAAGLESEPEVAVPLAASEPDIESTLAQLPTVRIRSDAMPAHLTPERFLALMIERVLDATPVNLHREARRRRASATADNTG